MIGNGHGFSQTRSAIPPADIAFQTQPRDSNADFQQGSATGLKRQLARAAGTVLALCRSSRDTEASREGAARLPLSAVRPCEPGQVLTEAALSIRSSGADGGSFPAPCVFAVHNLFSDVQPHRLDRVLRPAHAAGGELWPSRAGGS